MDGEPRSFFSPAGLRLAASLHLPEVEPEVGVVVCHGMLSSRASPKHVALCEAFARAGLAALRFDFSGRGDSEGRLEDLSYHRQVEEAGAAVALLRERVPRVGLVGSSMGGAVAVLTAARDPAVAFVAGLATVGLPRSLAERIGGPGAERRWIERGYLDVDGGSRLGPDLLRSAREVDVVAAAAALGCPLLLVHGAEDEVVPVAQARLLHGAAPGSRLEVLDGADHVFSRPEDRERVVALVVSFALEVLGRGAES